MSSFAENFIILRNRIDRIARQHGRNPQDIKLLAVSKMQPLENIDAALVAGQRLFGENRVQEAQEHWRERRISYPDLRLHLIGPLQTNKAREAVALFDCIETVDRESLVDSLVKEMQKQNRSLSYFIQVNTGNEPQKAGVTVTALPSLLNYCETKKLSVRGLMCIPPVNEPAAPHFALLRKLAQRHHLPELSMGMSADFEIAAALGATNVRIGSSLFGDRILS